MRFGTNKRRNRVISSEPYVSQSVIVSTPLALAVNLLFYESQLKFIVGIKQFAILKSRSQHHFLDAS